MNLEKLFEAQAILDQRIVERKGLQGVDLLEKKILSLQVELGECANEWRGFKYWSENQEPNGKELCSECNGNGYVINQYDLNEMDCSKCGGTSYENPLLEEYADCLHFILSIGNELGDIVFNQDDMDIYFEDVVANDIAEQFILTNWLVGSVYESKIHYEHALFNILKLGELLGFTRDQIEQGYYDKNKINHERQENGY